MEGKLKRQLTLTSEEWFRSGERRYGPDKASWVFKCPSCGAHVSFNDWRPRGDRAFIVDCYKCEWRGEGVKNPINVLSGDLTHQNIFDFAELPLTE